MVTSDSLLCKSHLQAIVAGHKTGSESAAAGLLMQGQTCDERQGKSLVIYWQALKPQAIFLKQLPLFESGALWGPDTDDLN